MVILNNAFHGTHKRNSQMHTVFSYFNTLLIYKAQSNIIRQTSYGHIRSSNRPLQTNHTFVLYNT